MNSSDLTKPPGPISDRQKAAFITLLGDEDRNIYQTVRGKILSLGPAVADWLRPHLLSRDPVLRRHAQEIVQHLARQAADDAFLAFCISHRDDLDLEEGVWCLARTQYPDINVMAYQALLDVHAAELKERLRSSSMSDNILATINQYLYDELGFRGNEEDYYDPDNSYLNRVIDRRTGNPISLCLIYLFIARRLRLPITGIGMPGHFLVRYQSSTGEVYVDAFNRGKLLTKADCVKYLLHTSHGFQESHLQPIPPRRTLLRVCTNLHQIYSQLELPDEMGRLQRYLVALAR